MTVPKGRLSPGTLERLLQQVGAERVDPEPANPTLSPMRFCKVLIERSHFADTSPLNAVTITPKGGRWRRPLG